VQNRGPGEATVIISLAREARSRPARSLSRTTRLALVGLCPGPEAWDTSRRSEKPAWAGLAGGLRPGPQCPRAPSREVHERFPGDPWQMLTDVWTHGLP
jgi:hypothetical protein